MVKAEKTTKKKKTKEKEEVVNAEVVLGDVIELSPQENAIEKLFKDKDFSSALDEISTLGDKEVADSIRHIELLDIRVKDAMKNYNSSEVKNQTNDLVLLKNTLSQVDPYRHEKGSWYSDIPVIGRFLKPTIRKVLQSIASNYTTVREEIDNIKDNIEKRLDAIEMDNIQLENLHGYLSSDTNALRNSGESGKFILKKLEEKKSELVDELDKQNLENMIHKVQRRVRNIQERISVNHQSLVTINTIIKDNDLVSEELKNTSTIATQVMSIGLTQQMALEKQKENIDGIKQLRDFTNSTLQKNADTLAKNTDDISSLYNESVLDLDKMKQNYDKIMGSIEKCENIQKVGYLNMKKQIQQLEEMNETYKDKNNLLENTNASTKTIEFKD